MALQSEVSPPLVGDPNKDTKLDGDTKSEEEDDTSQSSEDDVDLEEGEILDSGAEEEKDFTNSSLKDALDESCLQNIELLINQAKNAETENGSDAPKISPRKMNKRHGNYTDHDRIENDPEQEDAWFSKSGKHKKLDNRPVDYRNELEQYRGTPPSSPDRKKRVKKRRKSSKKSKKSSRKAITRKDAKGHKVMRYKKEAMKGKPCKYYKEGGCSKGADCPFSHVSEPRYKKKELCKFYLSGHCNKGKHCVYMHGEFPCKFHHTGSVCYAKEDCRFSHAPLTEEMKRVLAEYLRQVHGDRDHREDFMRDDDREPDRGLERDRKRHRSRSPEPSPPPVEAKPPPVKRVCLLGSPPRRIRESEETKRWQEEMKMLQQQNHPSFEINIMYDEEHMSPPHYPKPNFYQETLINSSPQKINVKQEGPSNLGPPPNFNQPIFPPRNFNEQSPHNNYNYEEFEPMDPPPPIKQEPVDDFDWEDSHNLNMNDVKPNQNMEFNAENSRQDLDFTSDVKFDETTQFSEMESSVDGPPTSTSNFYSKESDSETSNQETFKPSPDKPLEINPNPEPAAPPIVIPSHLPRKQRELFMRVQQHNQQKESVASVENVESQIKKEKDEEDEKIDSKSEEPNWYSSEEDDDDSDELLTDVLKKIQQAPPPKPAETKPAVNLMEMLSKIQQNSLDKMKSPSSTQQPNLLAPFLKNILGSVSSSAPVASQQTAPVISDNKRRTLLPNPLLPVVSSPDNLGPKEAIIPKISPQDPRLKNRDPRTLSSHPVPSSLQKQIISDNSMGGNTSPIELNFIGPMRSLTGMTNEPPKENIPYRLLGIYTKPPNYTPYINASQANPKLLNDPRLRKHLQPTFKVETTLGNCKNFEISKPPPPKDAPPIPELLLKFEKKDSFINIFESNSSSKSSENTQTNKHPLPMSAQRVCDPRMIRRDSRSNSGSDTPPHLTIVDTIKSPPQQEFKTAPILENSTTEAKTVEEKFPPASEKSRTPPHLESSVSEAVKYELDSDSEDSRDPPKLEFSGKSFFKKSPSPEREFIAIPKEPPSQDGNAPPIVPPIIIKKIKPNLASHLPRAIADPRMAKLHSRLDPRRLRLASSEKSLVERKTQPLPAKLVASSSTEKLKSSNSTDASKSPSGESETVEKEEKPKNAKGIPKKRRLSDKSEEKKKTVHRNRKSSMDYASPLNSYDDSVSISNSTCNSYNQRPKRSTNPLSSKVSNSPNLSSCDSLDTSSIPSFPFSDSSNIDCDTSGDVNLKDRFKTIDPTASPFC